MILVLLPVFYILSNDGSIIYIQEGSKYKKNIVEVKERIQFAFPVKAIRIKDCSASGIIGITYRNLEVGFFPRSTSVILSESHGNMHFLEIS